VIDVWNASQFKPSPSVATIANSVDFSDTGKFYFYASSPAVDASAEFNSHCAQQETGNAILGCYSHQRVYIYDVPNNQLDGIKQVTAAHETLHAIWERMSTADQTTVGALLQKQFILLNDPGLNERMSYYDRTEPGERNNELHSILGTEFPRLSSELEAHYAMYFKDRSKIVALHSNYQKVFDDLKAQSTNLSLQLKTLKQQIDSDSAIYNRESAALSSDVAALKAKQSTIDLTSAKQVNDYNYQRQVLITRDNNLEKMRLKINAESDNYNTIVIQYNQIVTSTNNLTQSLDSTLAPSSPSP
jgi:hypothetical protein